ncbi:hypothetical protein Pcinc_014820 [Petrolisthes cinctipes]|uniref:Uncharacterized protein n=1 Tax=Petrolisthes cinctipes TaxID=88211 RepID=A0AAE1FU91_PETCI|nr:hypothetical protein Pcinc_014820 [Petrolisthes cinctipes]
MSERSSNSHGYSNLPVFCDAKPYYRWKTEVGAWTKVIKLSKKQQGLTVALSFPDGSAVRDKVFNELEISHSWMQTMYEEGDVQQGGHSFTTDNQLARQLFRRPRDTNEVSYISVGRLITVLGPVRREEHNERL